MLPYRWPHISNGTAIINVAFSDGHAESVRMPWADYRRSTWNSATGTVWTWPSQADAFATLLFIGYDTNDFTRLRAWYPILPP